MESPPEKDHFHGQTALRHIAEVQSTGISAAAEIHGAETPGPIFAALDASREAAVLLACALIVLDFFDLMIKQEMIIGFAFGIGWAFWKGMRSAWLAWSQLFRLHRIASEEKKEIESNRSQEREELLALYGAKGFQGPLLEKVVDVLMADQDRLLRVMLQEEMGFRLEEHTHPLVQGAFALFGVFFSLILLIPFLLGFSSQVVIACSFVFVGILGAAFARLEKNNGIAGFCWNFMMAGTAGMLTRTCMEIIAS
jgi:vacuolar iron transporter family protein